MGQIEELFYENPGKSYYLRQIARLTKTPKTTAARKLKQLIQKKLILREKSEPYDLYTANTQNPIYKFYKKQFILEKILRSGLIDYIEETALPSCIILFGSCSKGEYTHKSDIDLFVESSEIPLKLESFRLGHKISIFFDKSFLNLSKPLRNTILNGNVLYGVLRIWKT